MFSVPKPDACKPLYPATTLPPSLLPLLRSSTRRAESDTVGPPPLFSDSFGQASSLCSRVFGASGMLLQGSQYAGNPEARRHTQTCINLQQHSLNRTSTAAVSHDSLHMHTPDKTRIKAFCSEPARISRLYTLHRPSILIKKHHQAGLLPHAAKAPQLAAPLAGPRLPPPPC